MTDPRELVHWNHAVRLRMARFFETLPWRVLVENHETSHQNIGNVFMHGCNMEDWWLHYVLPRKEWDGPKFDGFRSASSMRKRVLEVQRRTERLMKKLKPKDLTRKLDLSVLANSAPRPITLGGLLVETVTEDTHHRGEILAMLWRKDIQPPSVSFLDWSASRGRRGTR